MILFKVGQPQLIYEPVKLGSNQGSANSPSKRAAKPSDFFRGAETFYQMYRALAKKPLRMGLKEDMAGSSLELSRSRIRKSYSSNTNYKTHQSHKTYEE